MNMKLSTLALLTTLAAAGARAEVAECPYHSETDLLQETIDGIAAMKDCKQAADTARACMWGSSADVHIVATAQSVCEQGFGKRTKVEIEAYHRFQKLCWTKYTKDNPGTLYMSMAAHCALGVTEYFLDLLTPYSEEMEPAPAETTTI